MAAVIVLFHSEDVVEACVRSLVQGHRCPDVIAVVANSPIPSAVADRLRHMGAQVLPCEGNRGFAAACNRAASESNTDFLWFVNPDVECDASCLERLLAAAGPDATVAPTLRDAHGVLASPAKSSRYLSPWVLLARELRIGRWLRLGEAPVGRPHAATAMSGACLLVPRPAFLDVGGFDERYFLYGEDVDLCLRLAAVAVRLRVVADAVATHRAGTGSGSPPLPAVQGIKGREARRAHYLLLARYRSSTAAARYVRGLVWVLRARLAVARLVNPSVWDRDRSAYRWAVEQARSAGHGGE